jgi:hypothetical protein
MKIFEKKEEIINKTKSNETIFRVINYRIVHIINFIFITTSIFIYNIIFVFNLYNIIF